MRQPRARASRISRVSRGVGDHVGDDHRGGVSDRDVEVEASFHVGEQADRGGVDQDVGVLGRGNSPPT